MKRGKIIKHLKSVVCFIIFGKLKHKISQNVNFTNFLSWLTFKYFFIYFIRTSIFWLYFGTSLQNFILSIQVKLHINTNFIYILYITAIFLIYCRSILTAFLTCCLMNCWCTASKLRNQVSQENTWGNPFWSFELL